MDTTFLDMPLELREMMEHIDSWAKLATVNGVRLRPGVLSSLRHSPCRHKAKDTTPSTAWKRDA